MATPVFRPSSCIWQGSSTSTTGGDITLNVLAATGKLNFRDKYANGATGVPLELYDSTTGNQEFSYGTLVYGVTAALDKITSRVITYSSNGPGTPIAWAAGTRNAFCNCAAESFLFAENSLAEMTPTQLANALTNLGIIFGTSPGNVIKLNGSGQYPSADGSLITGLPTSPVPSGSKFALYQSAAPSGWTLITTLDDMVMFVTNGSGISGGGPHAGGTSAANTWDPTPTFTVGNHSLIASELPRVTSGGAGSDVSVISNSNVAAGHSHGISASSTWRPPAAYFILCSKN